jgi:putative transposase
MLLSVFAGRVNRHQLDVIEYLQEENRVLKERLGGRRLRFTDAERHRLARKAQRSSLISFDSVSGLYAP